MSETLQTPGGVNQEPEPLELSPRSPADFIYYFETQRYFGRQWRQTAESAADVVKNLEEVAEAARQRQEKTNILCFWPNLARIHDRYMRPATGVLVDRTLDLLNAEYRGWTLDLKSDAPGKVELWQGDFRGQPLSLINTRGADSKGSYWAWTANTSIPEELYYALQPVVPIAVEAIAQVPEPAYEPKIAPAEQWNKFYDFVDKKPPPTRRILLQSLRGQDFADAAAAFSHIRAIEKQLREAA